MTLQLSSRFMRTSFRGVAAISLAAIASLFLTTTSPAQAQVGDLPLLSTTPRSTKTAWLVSESSGGPRMINPDLATPTNLRAVDVGNEADVTLTWTASESGVAENVIERERSVTTNGTTTWASYGRLRLWGTQVTTRDTPGLGTFRYRIAAATNTGISEFSEWTTVEVLRGWTVFTPSADTRIVYVSSSTGNDANSGLSEAMPKRTIAAGYALLRNGYPDWLLLKRGDTWTTGFPALTRSGRSIAERQLIGTYGTAAARPRLNTGNTGAFSRGGASTATVDHISIVGLHLSALGRTSDANPNGFNFVGKGSDILIEGNIFDGYFNNIVVQKYDATALSNVRIRRNVLINGWSISGHAQGIYADSLSGLLIEENTFDQNGWNPTIVGAERTIFNHNMYLQSSNTDVIVRGNIVARGSATGVQLRGAGLVEDNFVMENPIGISVGHAQSPNPNTFAGLVRRNVVYDGADIGSAPRGFAFSFSNMAAVTFEDNIAMANTSSISPGLAWWGESIGMGVTSLVIRQNIVYAWGGPVQFGGDSIHLPNIDFSRNTIVGGPRGTSLVEHSSSSTVGTMHSTGNVFTSNGLASQWFRVGSQSTSFADWRQLVSDVTSSDQPVHFTDPNRSIESYVISNGLGQSRDDFYNIIRQQTPWSWDPRLTAHAINRYFHDGLTVVP